MSREIEQQEAPETESAPKKRKQAKANKPRIFRDLEGRELFIGKQGKVSLKEYSVDKFDADVLVYWHGDREIVVRGERKADKAYLLTEFDPDNARGQRPLSPSIHSPVCAKCALHHQGCHNPYLPYLGPKNPLITIIVEGVGRGEDDRGQIATDGNADRLKKFIEESQEETGVTLDDVRWLSMTRCANRGEKMLNLKSRGGWCRYHVIDDLMRHPPRMVIPVGTTVLGLLSHKSNAQEWTGRLLTYRGWPDGWLTNPKYALPRPDPRDSTKKVVGHPVFGLLPGMRDRIPMVPMQVPRLVYKDQNQTLNRRYRDSFVRALKMAKEGVEALEYTRPWYEFTDDADRVEEVLNKLIEQPGLLICYDTETTGLKPWATTWTKLDDEMVATIDNARIVSMMFRWLDVSGRERSIGFPWETGRWNIYPHRARLRPLIWKVLTQCKIIGHNLTFDALFSWATLNRKYTHLECKGWDDPKINRVRDRRMCALMDACHYDTWHMAFAFEQKRGSLGLEHIAYEWVPDLAGYEEDFTLLIDLHKEEMMPGEGPAAHYLNCPREKQKDLETYVMGDVEVAYRAYERIKEKLEVSETYEIPIADPRHPGEFRYFAPPDRNWVYENIMSPASRVLMKMMARGIFVDQDTLKDLAGRMPGEIRALRDELSNVDQIIIDYCDEMKRTEGSRWELDLENKAQLKELLFHRLRLPVLRVTKAGKKKWGSDNIDEIKEKVRETIIANAPELENNPKKIESYVEPLLYEFAAVDKFTLNKLTVQMEKLRPLRKYRKQFKLYSTYIRPLQNITTLLDKRSRKGDAHLCFDGCIHASFLMTGTRGGRLSCKDPNLQQLPRDGEVKSLFVSRFGERGCIYQGDLSQIELRLLAAASGDPTMVKAYFDGVDLHTLTASRIFEQPYEEFSKEHMKKLQDAGKDDVAKELDQKRNIAKTVNFLTGYGGGAFGLQNVLAMKDIDKPIEECEQIIELFFDSYPAVKKLLRFYKAFIEREARAVSIFGRVRVFEEILGDDQEARSKALRAGCNHLIQSTASDMMLTALFVIEGLMRDANLESMLVSTVHDSLLVDCVREELPLVHEIVTSVLNNFPTVFKSLFGANFDTSWMIVPFSGDCEVGLDYLHVKKITGEAADIDWDKLLASEGH